MQKRIQWLSVSHLPAPPSAEALHLWRIDLDCDEGDLSALSDDEQHRAEQMITGQTRRRFRAARSGLRRVLGGYLGLSPDQIEFDYNGKGKPSLALNSSSLHFNLSHADDLAIIAISSTCPVGVDIEPFRSDTRNTNRLRIAKRVLGDTACALLATLPVELQQQAFLEQWTTLEASIKAVGAGIFDRSALNGQKISTCSFVPEENWLGALTLVGDAPEAKDWQGFRLGSF